MSALTWFAYDVSFLATRKARLSWAARGIDDALVCEAFSEPDGSCSVPLSRVRELCEDTGLDALEIGRELVRSRLWEASPDKSRLIAPWLLVKRQAASAKIEQTREAGRISGEKRKAEAEARKARNAARREQRERTLNGRSKGKKSRKPRSDRGQSDTPPKSLPERDMHDRSTDVEQRDGFSGSSFSSRTNELPLSPDASGDAGAPSPSASHAGGAAGDGARIKPGHLLRLQAAQVLDGIAVPPAWGSTVAELASALGTAAPEVDAERALFRACAAWQAGGDPEGHAPLLAEAFGLLAGDDGRASLLPTAQAPRAVALALHGALIMPAKLQPLALRKLAILIGRELPADEPDPLRVACFIAGEVANNRRPGLDFRLPADGVTERALPWAMGGAR